MITWYATFRPRKADQGHTAVKLGKGQPDGIGAVRKYILCECGTRCSGRGYGEYHDKAVHSHRQHQKRMIKKGSAK